MVVDGLGDESSLHWTGSDTHDGPTIWDFVPKGRHSNVLVTTRDECLARRFVERKHQFIVEVSRLQNKDAAFDRAVVLAKQLGETARALTFTHPYCTKVNRKIDLKAYGELLKLPERSKSDPTANAVLAWRFLHRGLKAKHPDAATLLHSLGALNVQSIPKDFFQKTDWKLTRTLEEYGMIERLADDRVVRVTEIVRLCLHETVKGTDHELDEALLTSILAALKFQTKSLDGKKSAATLHLKVAQYYQHIGRLEAAKGNFEKCLAPRPKDSKRPYFLSDKDAESVRQFLAKVNADLQHSMSSTGRLVKASKGPASRAVLVPNPREIHTELQRLEKTSRPLHASTIQKVAELAALRLACPTRVTCLQTIGLGSHAASVPGKNNRSVNTLFLTGQSAVTPPQSDDTTKDDTAAIYQRLLASAVDSYGPNSMHAANAHYSLAIAHESEGNFSYPECLHMLRVLACLYARQGNDHLQQAQRIFTFVLHNQVKILGDTHPETPITREWEAAGQELERILVLQGYWLGRGAQETLQTACSLAMNYAAREKRKEAEELFRATLATQQQVLGDTHVDMVTTAERLREFLVNADRDRGKGR
ncbi:hypothetical protein QBC36DRAFT_391140 [Triangularia setosa]|uniref:Kinesin light chain n=1 Tax=Triangularia setosa TaxID=2587417 RepID=A0AAN6VX99_9PEZI|nr:hypothetical protein QBC36DRAFT_391140 [Podospora setosa]